MHIRSWNVDICERCLRQNEDGIVPEMWPHVIPELEAKGIDVKLNGRGRVDIPI